jgi:nucleoside-diphosphate-sugar epimerase
MRKLLITGGNGFIGKAICENLKSLNYLVKITSRKNIKINDNRITSYNIGEIDKQTKWINVLDDIDCVIHCAAKTHFVNNIKKSSLFSYKKVNIEGTVNLAEKAAACGVKRFIFLSSIKVNGEKTLKSRIFKHNDIPKPEDAYGISKWEAEKALWKISKKTGLEIVIIRAPLVYGSGVKGNLNRLINLVKLGIPLPFSQINNRRSLIGIDNLVDIIIQCIDNPKVVGKTFLVSDGKDLSTPELINLIALSMGKKANLFPLPIFILKFLGLIFGRREEISRLIGSLKIDNSHLKKVLNWAPLVSAEDGIKKMIQKNDTLL